MGRKKGFIVLLLLLSCIASIIVLSKMEPPVVAKLHSVSQLDSLISITFDHHRIHSGQVRVQTVEIDSLFTRNIYTVNVPPDFSKTSFHYSLQQNLWPYEVKTTGQVQFPEKNLRIHLLVNDNVHRSLFINTE